MEEESCHHPSADGMEEGEREYRNWKKGDERGTVELRDTGAVGGLCRVGERSKPSRANVAIKRA